MKAKRKIKFFLPIVFAFLICVIIFDAPKAEGASCSATALATGTDVAAATIAPGTAIADRGVFTLTGNGTSCANVTALTVTLAASGTPYDGLAEVRITNSAGSTTYFSAVTTFASNSVSFSGGTTIPVTNSTVTFKIRVTPKTHANMPAVPGASYAINPLVSSWTTTMTKSGSDTNPNTTTIDNASPNGATSASGSGGDGANTLNWTTSNSADFKTTSGSIVLRWAAASAGNAVPAEGNTSYAVGNTIVGGDTQTATVACVISSAASTALSGKIDGTGGSAGCNTSALSNGTSYSYKVFQLDNYGNYDAGVTIGTFLTKPAAPTSVAATDGTYTDKVTVTWTKSTSATGYRVYRDGVDVSGVLGDVATYDDTGAAAPTVTPGTASATDGTATNKITLSISGASANNGTTHTYKLHAINATGESADSATDTGYRGVGALTYQWYRSSGTGDSGYASLSGATTAPYDDSTAPAPSITAGSAVASDGTSSSYVTLSLSGSAANVGAVRYYYATVSATGAASANTTHNDGYIGVGALTYQWQRSAADSDASYSDISGATTAPYNDTGAPADGSGRYFKCVLNAAGATQQISTSDRGYRIAGSLGVDIVDSGGTPVGSPSVTFLAKNFNFSGQTSSGTLGVSSQKIRVTNTTSTASWNLTINATGGDSALWSDGSHTFDYNGTSALGRLQVDATAASGTTITPQGGCASTGLSLPGSATYFTSGGGAITMVTAGGTAQTSCYWDFTGITLNQDIPASQATGNYSLGMTLTVS